MTWNRPIIALQGKWQRGSPPRSTLTKAWNERLVVLGTMLARHLASPPWLTSFENHRQRES